MIRRIFKTLVFFSIIGLFAASYFYSMDVYRFYITAYYKKYRHTTMEDIKRKSSQLLEEKNYEQLESYLRDIIIVFPHDLDIIRIAGQCYMRMGKKSEGADLIVASLEGADITREELEKVLAELMQQGYYGEIVGIRNMGLDRKDAGLHFVYGKSLYKIKNYREAYKELIMAREQGMDDVDLLYYLGVTSDNMGNVKEALSFLEEAKKLSDQDPQINNALIDMYRKTGQYEKAAELTLKRRMR